MAKIKPKRLDSTSVEINKKADAPIAIGDGANIFEAGTVQEIEPISTTDLGKLAQEEKFMFDKLKIMVLDTTDENELPGAPIVVNEKAYNIPRGVECTVPRCVVEVLARSKATRYKQPRLNPLNPDQSNQLIPKTANCYPFSVIHDPHPHGREWLKRILAEAA